MKKFIALAALTVSSFAFAANNSSINDLQYLPNAGTAYGTTDFTGLKLSDRSFDGTNELKTEVTGYLIAQSLGYALMDNFSLAVGLNYQDSENKTTGERTTDTTGLGDINVLGRYRLVDTENRLDILGKVTVSPGDAETDRSGDSNGFTGGHSVGLGLEYGQKQANYQWALQALYTHKLKTTLKDKSSGTTDTIKDDAHGALSLGANLLTRITESSFIRNFAGVEFEAEYDDNQNSTTTGSTIYTVGAEYQYVATKDIYLRGGISSMIAGNGYNAVFMLYNVGATYQF